MSLDYSLGTMTATTFDSFTSMLNVISGKNVQTDL